MSHEITCTNGVHEMAYVGETPWHGLGQQLERGASIETWKVAAGMNWSIEESPVYSGPVRTTAIDGKPSLPIRIKVADKKILYRGDTLAPLGVVGDGFAVVQPGEVLEFFRDLTQEAGFNLETAGTLFGGKRFWALAHIGDDAEIVPGDKVGGYLLLCTAADGTLATTGKFTTVRVVCNNTLSMSLDRQGETKMRHRSAFDPVRMKESLGIAHSSFAEFKEQAQTAAQRYVSNLKAEALTLELLAPRDVKTLTPDEQIKVLTKIEKGAGYQKIMSLFGGEGLGAKLDGVSGTGWGWVNAVTQYVDHEMRAKSVDHRMSSAFFGKGDEMKSDALRLALA